MLNLLLFLVMASGLENNYSRPDIGLLADSDTLSYDGSPATYYQRTDLKYFWAKFNIRDFKPDYNSQDSTFFLTYVTIYLFNSQAGKICSLWVYDGSGNLLQMLTYPVLGGTLWNEFRMPYIPIYDDSFTIVIFLPVRRTGNRYRALPYWDDGTAPDSMSGWILNDTYIPNTERDLNLRAIGRFAPHDQSFHDVGIEGLYYSTPFVVGSENNSLLFRLYNYGQIEETNVPATLYFGSDTASVSIPSLPTLTYTDVAFPNFSFTPDREGLFGNFGGFISVNYDADLTNDTLRNYSFYQFPKYTYLAQEFEFPEEFPPQSWTSIDGNADGDYWWFGDSKELAHSGRFFAISPASPLSSDDWLFLPAVTVDQNFNTSFGFYARTLSPGSGENLKVFITSSPNPSSILELVFDISAPDAWTRFTSSLDKYRGETVYVAFRKNGTDSDRVLLDDVFVRRVPLGQNQVLREEFEELLPPPGWVLSNNLWFGASPEDVNVPDNGTGHIFCFNSSAPEGTHSELISPFVKYEANGNALYYSFKYCNLDGNDSLQIWYRFRESEPWTHHATLTATSGWEDITGESILIPTKQTIFFEAKLVGFSDGGSTNIAIDNFEVYNTTIPGVNDVIPTCFRINTISRGISVETAGLKNGISLDIYDAVGRKIESAKILKTGKYEFKNITPGIYFVIVSGDINESHKILVVK